MAMTKGTPRICGAVTVIRTAWLLSVFEVQSYWFQKN